MKRAILFYCWILMIAPVSIFAQSAFLPTSLGTSVNSVYEDVNPVITPDGKRLYFVRANHPENTYLGNDSEDIWFSDLQADGSWSASQHLLGLNVARYNAVLSVAADGSLLINGQFNKKGTFWRKRGLSLCTIQGNAASAPIPLKVTRFSRLNRGVKCSGAMSTDGQYIVLSLSRAYNGFRNNLFYCRKKKSNKYNHLRPLRSLNSLRSEDTPFLSADSKTLYFSSDRETKGRFIVYRSTRTGDDWSSWSDPKPLSDTVNASPWNTGFRTNKKGSWGYYSSMYKSQGGADLYKVKIFEENPFVIVTGRILHSQTKRPLLSKTITLNLKNDPSLIKVNPDSATYRVQLPLGKLYTLTASTPNYSPGTATIDVTKAREFIQIRQDIVLDAKPFVLLKGRLYNESKEIIPSKSHPMVFINGVKADSVVIDTTWGSYTMRMKIGFSYSLSVEANGYRGRATDVNLGGIDEFQEMTIDLYADQDRIGKIAGSVIDKKTNKPVTTIPVTIRVEGVEDPQQRLDSLTGSYELVLPLGAAYTVSASAVGYYPLYEPIDLRNETKSVKLSKDLVIIPIEVGQSIRLNNIFFETGKATLKSESFAELDRVAIFLRDNPDIKIEIGGHTDNVGKAASNLKLSQARASAVTTYITLKGIAKEKIVAKGYGSEKPVTSNATTAGKAQNRRVEFTVLDK